MGLGLVGWMGLGQGIWGVWVDGLGGNRRVGIEGLLRGFGGAVDGGARGFLRSGYIFGGLVGWRTLLDDGWYIYTSGGMAYMRLASGFWLLIYL